MKALDPNTRGALFMVVCMLGFTLNDTLMKVVLAEVPLFQAIFLRGVAASLVLAVLAMRMGAFTKRFWNVPFALLIRVGAEVGGTICFFSALIHVPIADATAIAQAIPLAVTLGAAVFLREKVGWRRALAIGIGFAGVMIIIRPGSGAVSAYSYLVVATVFFIAVRDLATRRLAIAIPSIKIALLTAMATTGFAGLMSLGQAWSSVSVSHLGLMAAAACLLCVGYVFSVMALRIGDISFSAPFRYVALVWAIIAGVVVFGDVPDVWMLAGSAIVIGTGIYTFYRERRVARRAGVQPIAATTEPPP
jgi:drug/metabolite transporter (DMT)-like permease